MSLCGENLQVPIQKMSQLGSLQIHFHSFKSFYQSVAFFICQGHVVTLHVVSSDEKSAHDQLIITSHDWHAVLNMETMTYPPSGWAAVKDNIYRPENWSFSQEEQILTEHSIS
jgi:hypothetical protein